MGNTEDDKPVYYRKVYGAVLDDTPESADWIKPKYLNKKPTIEPVVAKTTVPPKEETKRTNMGWYEDGEIDPDAELLKQRALDSKPSS